MHTMRLSRDWGYSDLLTSLQAGRPVPWRERYEPIRGTRCEPLHGVGNRDIAEQAEQTIGPGIHIDKTRQWRRQGRVPRGQQGDRPRERGVRV
jgi:hypothetical protein